MIQLSENSVPLKTKKVIINKPEKAAEIAPLDPCVCLFLLPYNSSKGEVKIDRSFTEFLIEFIKTVDRQTIICLLTTPQTSSDLLLKYQDSIQYKLWISIKYKQPIFKKDELPYNHSELLILGKFKGNLKHTKTRIPYTYCPACDKTTKDYGGKKHTYHEYGTLMSDVWRDIFVCPDEFPTAVVERLKYLFGLSPYKDLFVYDMLKLFKYKKETPLIKHFNIADVNSIGEKHRDQLINGDCLEELKKIPSNSVDYCFADPPYNLKKKYDNWNDNLDVQEYFEWCDNWLYELGRVVKPGCTVTILNIPLWSVRHYKFMKEILNFQSWIVWEGLSLPVRMIMPANYTILSFSKGRPRKIDLGKNQELLSLKEFYCIRQNCINSRDDDKEAISDLWWDVHRLKHNTRRVDHPCQLPPALMRRLISLFTMEGEIVLDPFNGVATTTLSAQQLNRRYIGIELSEKYHHLAQLRHKELSQGLDPFRKNGDTPKAKNSPVPRLKKLKYAVSKKELQLEVKRISKEINRLPTKEDVQRYSKYPLEYYENYFISWGEVCAAARTTGMVEIRTPSKKKNIPQLELF